MQGFDDEDVDGGGGNDSRMLNLDVGARGHGTRSGNVRVEERNVDVARPTWESVLDRIDSEIDDARHEPERGGAGAPGTDNNTSQSSDSRSLASHLETYELVWRQRFRQRLKKALDDVMEHSDSGNGGGGNANESLAGGYSFTSSQQWSRDLERRHQRATAAAQKFRRLTERSTARSHVGAGTGGAAAEKSTARSATASDFGAYVGDEQARDFQIIVSRAVEILATLNEVWTQRAAEIKNYYASVLCDRMVNALAAFYDMTRDLARTYRRHVRALDDAASQRAQWRRANLGSMPEAERRQRSIDEQEYSRRRGALYQQFVSQVKQRGSSSLERIEHGLETYRRRWQESDQKLVEWTSSLQNAAAQVCEQLVDMHRDVVLAIRETVRAQRAYGESLVAWTASKQLEECLERMQRVGVVTPR